MEPGHLLHSALTHPSSADARRLKSRHPFVPAAQQLISSSDNNNICVAHWADHHWNADPQDSEFSFPAPIPLEQPSQEEHGSGLTASAAVSGISAPVCINGLQLPLRPVSVVQNWSSLQCPIH